MRNKLNNSNTGQKCYWKIKVTSKYKAPKIPPLFVNNLFVLSCKEKAKHFAELFLKQ